MTYDYFGGTYSWKSTKSETTEMAVPKMTIMIMAVKILAAAEGLRPRALMLA